MFNSYVTNYQRVPDINHHRDQPLPVCTGLSDYLGQDFAGCSYRLNLCRAAVTHFWVPRGKKLPPLIAVVNGCKCYNHVYSGLSNNMVPNKSIWFLMFTMKQWQWLGVPGILASIYQTHPFGESNHRVFCLFESQLSYGSSPCSLLKSPQFSFGSSPFPIGSMYAIYGNIYHQYTPVMLAYIYIYHTWILWVLVAERSPTHFSRWFYPWIRQGPSARAVESCPSVEARKPSIST